MRNWIPGAVLYQINLRSLAAREPRNAIEAAQLDGKSLESPLAYITRHVPVLKRLGVNVLYLMPLYPMGIEARKGIGSPYSIRNYRDVDPEFGTREELGLLVRRAHRLGMRVILDITPNHTARDHEWITHHPDYYVRNEQGEAIYDFDWSDTAKLNYRNPALRREMIETFDFWLSFLGPDKSGRPEGVDGFRLDMAHLINDLSFWNEATAELRSRHPARHLLFLAECYGTQNNLNLFSRGINAAYDDDFYKVLAFLYGVNERGESVICPDPAAAQHADFLDKWEAFRENGIAGAVATALTNYEGLLPTEDEAPRLARYTDNHDEGRGLYRAGPGAVRAMMQVAFYSNHSIPMLLTGQEFGALNRPSIHTRIGLCDKGRRICSGGRVWSEPGLEWEGNLFARTPEERRSWYRFYQGLIAVRHSHPALTRGRFMLIESGEDAPPQERTVIAFDRYWRRIVARCAVNLGPEPRKVPALEPKAGWNVLYGRLEDGYLPPFQGIVLTNR